MVYDNNKKKTYSLMSKKSVTLFLDKKMMRHVLLFVCQPC